MKPSAVIEKENNLSEQRVNEHALAGNKIVRALNSPFAVWAIVAFFLAVLLIWNLLDHRIPHHDSAWHAIYSASVKRFILHPKDWNFTNLIALGKQHFNYPPGAWVFNGFLKVIFGDGFLGDKVCLIVQSLLLAASFYWLSMVSFADRVKANLGLIVLMCFPLVCALQRQTLIDLYQLVLYTAFLAAIATWCKKPSWKNTFITGVLMGLHCISKQTAVLYCGPIVAVLFLYQLWKKRYQEAAQLFLIGSVGPLALLIFWVLPNWTELTNYVQWRAPGSVSITEKLTRILSNLNLSSSQILESAGPVFLFVSLVLSWKSNFYDAVKKIGIPLFAGIVGWLLIITVAYYNAPASRYFGAVLVPIALLFGAFAAESIRSNSRLRVACGVAIPVLAIAQMLFLCFRPAPLDTSRQDFENKSCDLLGIKKDILLRSSLGFDRNGDPWRQKWIFKQINSIDGYRYVWLNVLPSSREFDQGSMIYLGQRMKSHACPVSWRSCTADMSDSFSYTENDFNTIDWFLLKTGNQGGPLVDKKSKENFEKVTYRVEKGGDFVLFSQTNLPDGSLLKLYRKDYVKIWNRNALKLWFPNGRK